MKFFFVDRDLPTRHHRTCARGDHRQVPDASHYVIFEQPGVIAAVIAEVIVAAAK